MKISPDAINREIKKGRACIDHKLSENFLLPKEYVIDAASRSTILPPSVRHFGLCVIFAG
jgi:hypothetical protein